MTTTPTSTTTPTPPGESSVAAGGLSEGSQTAELGRPVVGLGGHRRRWARRLHDEMTRARSDHRRLLPTMAVATMAATLTYGGLSSTLSRSEPISAHSSGGPEAPPADRHGQATDPAQTDRVDADRGEPIIIGDDHRTLALDRHAVLLPTEVGQPVEVVALRPTLDSVEASVIAEAAMVVAVDESVVVVRLSTEEARRAVEALGVGSVTLLGTG